MKRTTFVVLTILLILGILLLVQAMHSQAIDSSVHVNQFPGPTVAAKLTNAMKTCTMAPAAPCILVLDPSLAPMMAYPVTKGTFPALCSNCYLEDFTAGPPFSTPGSLPVLLKGYTNSDLAYQMPVGAYSASNGIACYGDSITGGIGLPSGAPTWCQILSQLLNAPVKTNSGATGLTTAGSLACALGACGYGSSWPDLNDFNPVLSVDAFGMNNADGFGMTVADLTYLNQTYGADIVWKAISPSESLFTYSSPISTTGTACGTNTVTFQTTFFASENWNMLPEPWTDTGYTFAASDFAINTAFNGQTFAIQNLPSYSPTGYTQLTFPYSGDCTAAGSETGTLTFNGWTNTGTVTTDTTTFHIGSGGRLTFQTLASDASESENILPIGSSGELFVWYLGYPSGGGSATISVNGVVQTDHITELPYLSAVQGEHSGFDPPVTVNLAIFTGLSVGIPTVTIQAAGGKFSVIRIASPQGSKYGSHVPKVGVFGVNFQAEDDGEPGTGFYDTAIKQWVKTLATTYGLTNVVPIDQRSAMNTVGDFYGGVGSCPGLQIPIHPGCGGHLHMAQAAFDSLGAGRLPSSGINVLALSADSEITAAEFPAFVFSGGHNLKIVGSDYPADRSDLWLTLYNNGSTASAITWTSSGGFYKSVGVGCSDTFFFGDHGPIMTATTCGPGGSVPIDEDFSFTGCTIPTGGNGECHASVNFTTGTTPTFSAMPDTNYTAECTADVGSNTGCGAGNAVACPQSLSLWGKTASTINYQVGMSVNATNTAYASTIYCHLHHN